MTCFEVGATIVDIGFSFPHLPDKDVPFEIISGLTKLFIEVEI